MELAAWLLFCFERHDVIVSQKYDTIYPYSYHLNAVDNEVQEYQYCIPSEKLDVARKGALGHDLIEDTRLTYNDLDSLIGKEVAEIIYCCTEEKGRDRRARHSDRYYEELADNKLATYVKLCDVIANVKHSIATKSGMIKKYRAEYPRLKSYLYCTEYGQMFLKLDELLKE